MTTGWKRESRRQKQLPPDWQRRRKAVLARDGGQCVFCGAPATDVDHIDPQGGHELDNLRALCHHCHMSRTQAQSAQARRRGMWQTRRPSPHRPPRKHPGLK